MNITLFCTPIGRRLWILSNFKLGHLIAFAVVAVLCQSCESSHLGGVPASRISTSTKPLDPGDTLRITFPGAQEYNQTQKIRSDGRISLPLVGEVRAAGKKVGDLQDQLKGLYKSQLQNSEVVVNVENGAAVVYVAGAVGKPTRVLLDRPMTAFEAIMEAGGFQAGLANLKKVTLIRSENGKHRTWKLDVTSTLNEGTSEAVYLKPYDIIYVGERFF